MAQPSRLYPILDAAWFSCAADLYAAAEQLLAAGCTLIQYRNKSGNARVMLEQGRELRQRVRPHPKIAEATIFGWDIHSRSVQSAAQDAGRVVQSGSSDSAPRTGASGVPGASGAPGEWGAPQVRLIMNDRADLCLAADFNGVHVGQDDLSPESVRRIIGPGRWLGVSTHNPEQLREADLTSADYLAIGPVFATFSKDKPGPVVGLDGVRRARALTRKPLVAIGGITRGNAASVIEAGADAVAVISDLLRDPGKSAEEFLRILR